MSDYVVIGGSPIGAGFPAVVVAELGINHNGDMHTLKHMVDAAVHCEVNAVKLQTRTVDVVYSPEELARPRESPFGDTNGDLKRGLEFDAREYVEIDAYCHRANMTWFASCWDEASVDRIAQFNPPCLKIASPCLTDDNLLKHHLQYKVPIVLSTGMSTINQIDHAVNVLGDSNLVLMHCVSAYPCRGKDLNLRMINTLYDMFGVPVGYSGHEVGLATTVAAVAMGATMVERHFTLDRSMFGSDQSASVEPQGMSRLVRDIREVERAMGDGVKRISDSEMVNLIKLRRK